MKRCRKCQEEKPLSEFYRNGSKDGFMSSCKKCHRAYVHEYGSQPEHKARKALMDKLRRDRNRRQELAALRQEVNKKKQPNLLYRVCCWMTDQLSRMGVLL